MLRGRQNDDDREERRSSVPDAGFTARRGSVVHGGRAFSEREVRRISAPCHRGLFGGADSTALAVILRCLGVSLVLAHLDHRLRPESGEEAESARRFAERLGVPCMVRRMDVEALARSEGIGLEDAGRRARYAFFDSALLSERAEWVVTGHHLDDLSEDVLMRLVRGSGWPGLGGMKAVEPAGVSCALCLGRHGRSWRLFSALSAWTGSKTPRTGAMPSGATVCAIMSFRC